MSVRACGFESHLGHMIEKIKKAAVELNEDDAAVMILHTIDVALIDGKFKSVNKLYSQVKVSDFTLRHLLGMLTMGFRYKKNLSEYDGFAARIHVMAVEQLGEMEANNVMHGLM